MSGRQRRFQTQTNHEISKQIVGKAKALGVGIALEDLSGIRDRVETTAEKAFRRRFGNWQRIGSLVFNEAVASYNGDFVIHFNHPTWRDDRNDPSTATRVNERKVR